jgi:hypothetical protein
VPVKGLLRNSVPSGIQSTGHLLKFFCMCGVLL